MKVKRDSAVRGCPAPRKGSRHAGDRVVPEGCRGAPGPLTCPAPAADLSPSAPALSPLRAGPREQPSLSPGGAGRRRSPPLPASFLPTAADCRHWRPASRTRAVKQTHPQAANSVLFLTYARLICSLSRRQLPLKHKTKPKKFASVYLLDSCVSSSFLCGFLWFSSRACLSSLLFSACYLLNLASVSLSFSSRQQTFCRLSSQEPGRTLHGEQI